MAGRMTCLLLLLVAISILLTTASGAHHHHHHQHMEMSAWSEEEEFGLDSEGSRRILATTNYISYDALKRDSVPCSRTGASYYNCRPGASANPYTRGCSAITKCRS